MVMINFLSILLLPLKTLFVKIKSWFFVKSNSWPVHALIVMIIIFLTKIEFVHFLLGFFSSHKNISFQSLIAHAHILSSIQWICDFQRIKVFWSTHRGATFSNQSFQNWRFPVFNCGWKFNVLLSMCKSTCDLYKSLM